MQKLCRTYAESNKKLALRNCKNTSWAKLLGILGTPISYTPSHGRAPLIPGAHRGAIQNLPIVMHVPPSRFKAPVIPWKGCWLCLRFSTYCGPSVLYFALCFLFLGDGWDECQHCTHALAPRHLKSSVLSTTCKKKCKRSMRNYAVFFSSMRNARSTHIPIFPVSIPRSRQ